MSDKTVRTEDMTNAARCNAMNELAARLPALMRATANAQVWYETCPESQADAAWASVECCQDAEHDCLSEMRRLASMVPKADY